MPAPVYLTLTPEQDSELLRLTRNPHLDPRTRARIDAIRLSGKHWQAQHIAQHLGLNIQTVRRAYERYRTAGLTGLLPKQGRKLQPVITAEMRDHLHALLQANAASQHPRTYTAPDLARELEERFGLKVHRETVRRVMAALGYSYKRTRFVPAREPDAAAYQETAERLEGLQGRGQRDERT